MTGVFLMLLGDSNYTSENTDVSKLTSSYFFSKHFYHAFT